MTIYLIAPDRFIFLPVVVLVHVLVPGRWLPVPPFKGLSLRWYERCFANRQLMEALGNSRARRR